MVAGAPATLHPARVVAVTFARRLPREPRLRLSTSRLLRAVRCTV
jgi:hypothetical protein